MKEYFNLIVILIPIYLCNSVYAGNKFEVGNDTYNFRSEISGMEYSLFINLPKSYAKDSLYKYPVLYVLDGQWDFGLMVSIYNNLHFDNAVPDIIIVGVAYNGQNVNYDSLRLIDMTPTKLDNPNITTGGGLKFLQVLKKEVIPYIDDKYRTNKKERAISGTSLAGFYSHYLLFSANDLFNGFIMVNPYFLYDNEVSFKYEKDYSLKNRGLSARIYMCSGEFDISDVFFRMVHKIQSRNYTGIDFEYSYQKGMGHTGSKHEGYSRGLMHLYKQNTLFLGKGYLQQFVGNYLTEANDTVRLIIDGENLVIQKSRTVPFNIKLYTLPDSSFCAERNYVPFYINKNIEKNVYEFSYDGFLHQLKATKSIIK